MRTLYALCCTLPLLTMLWAVPSALGEEDIPDCPVWTNDADFGFGVLAYEATTEIEFDRNEGPQHALEMEGYIAPDDDADVVCVTEVLTVVSAEDDQREELYRPGRVRSRGIESVQFSPVLDNFYFDEAGQPMTLALVEIDETPLRRSAYTIREFEIKTRAIFAQERAVVRIPAIVTDNVTETDYDLKFRLSSMKINRNNQAEAVVEVERAGGEGKPILDALYAVDNRGNRIGGGRWVKPAAIFAREVNFEVEFVIDDSADVDHLELVVVTEYETRDVVFTVTDLFQE